MFRSLLALTSAAIALAVAGQSARAADAGPVIEVMYSTLYDHMTPGGIDPNMIAKKKVSIPFKPGSAAETSVNSTDPKVPDLIGVHVHKNRALQKINGAGCGITDAASIVLQDLKASQPKAYEEIMNLLWNQTPEWRDKGGASLTKTRSPLGASDFGIQVYSYDDTEDGSPDPELANFNINKAPKMWATHADIGKLSPNVERWFAPWSAPAWMKTPAEEGKMPNMIGGALNETYDDVFAKYLVRSMTDITKKLGGQNYMLSLQNEPLYTSDNYPGMKLPANRSAPIGTNVRKLLDAGNLKFVGLTAYDHNWDKPEYPVEVFDDSNAFSGVSWHCYGGSPDQQEEFTRPYPGYRNTLTECTRITQDLNEPWRNIRKSSSDIFGTIEYGSDGVILWNCALLSDEDGFTTPSLPKTCANCLAPILINKQATGVASPDGTANPPGPDAKATRKRAFRRPRQVDAPRYKLTSDFVVLGHFTRASHVRSDKEGLATRIGVTSSEASMDYPDGERVKVQSYRTPLNKDDENGKARWSVNILQKNDHFLTGKYENVTLELEWNGMVAKLENLPVGLHTVEWVA